MYTREEIKILPIFMRRLMTKSYHSMRGVHTPKHVSVRKESGNVKRILIYYDIVVAMGWSHHQEYMTNLGLRIWS